MPKTSWKACQCKISCPRWGQTVIWLLTQTAGISGIIIKKVQWYWGKAEQKSHKGYQCHMDECQHLHRSDSVNKKQCSREMIEAGLLKLLQCIFSHKLLRIMMESFQVCKGQERVVERKNVQAVVEWKSSKQNHDGMKNSHLIHGNVRNRRQVHGNVSNRRQVLEEWRNRRQVLEE